MYDDDNDKKDDGSVWTSYSDLFTTVAVIFLVMFVFALIKAGVSSMKNVVDKRQHEAELKGKISQKVKKQTESKISTVNKSLDEINQYENLIDKKMQEMGKFVQNLQKNRKVMKDLIKDQSRKEAQLAVVSEEITKVEEKLQITNLKTQKLEKIVDTKNQLIEKLDLKKSELQKAIELSENKIIEKDKLLEKEMIIKDELSKKVAQIKQNLENEKIEKKQRDFKIVDLQNQLEKDREVNSKEIQKLAFDLNIKSKIEVELSKSIQEKIDQIKKLDKHTAQLENELNSNRENIKNQIFQISNQETMIEQQSQKITQLNQWQKSKKQQIDSLDTKVSELELLKDQQIEANKQLENINKNLVTNKQKLTEDLIAKTQILDNVNQKLTTTKNNYEKTLSKLKVTEQSERNLKVANSELAKKKSQFEDLIGSLQQENRDWKSKSNSLASEKNLLSKNLNTTQAKNVKLQSLNVELGQKVSKLSSENSQSKNQNEFFKRELSDKNTDIQTLTASLKTSRNQINDLSGQLANSQFMNEQLTSKNDRLVSESRSNQMEIRGLQQKNIQAEQQLLAAESDASNLKAENLKIQNKLASLQNDKSNVGRKIASVEANLDNLKFEKQQNEQKLVACETDKNLGANRLKELEKKFSEKLGRFDQSSKGLLACNKSKSNLVKHNSDLKESLNDFATKVANVKGKLRSNIANDLAKAFKGANLTVMVDKKSGNVVFQMDKNFRFKKNSYYLNKAARNTLKKIIPIYSKVLFGNKKIKDKIAGFNVTGHASPSHKGKYVSPQSSNSNAYAYNMRLSAQRAASVTNYIFGRKIGKYSFKNFLKEYTSSIGQGFTKPVQKKGRKVASDGACGPYDCYSSQRVELSFTIKDDVESINKLIEMAKDIK